MAASSHSGEPPPRRPGPETEAYERECLATVERTFGGLAHLADNRVDRFELRGEHPDTAVVVHFTDRYGQAHSAPFPIWDSEFAEADGSPPIPEAFAAIVWANVDDGSAAS